MPSETLNATGALPSTHAPGPATSNVNVWQRRLAAVAEVTAVNLLGLFASAIVGKLVGKWIGLRDFWGMVRSATSQAQPDYYAMAWAVFVILALQYFCLFVFALPIGWWHRRRSREGYGLTRAGHSFWYLVGVGFVLCAVADLPEKLLLMINKYHSLGAGPQHWALFDKTWTLGFWVFMAAGSFVVVPVVEELFYRGYMQSRLAEDFDGGSAILMTSVFFAFSHAQYHRASALSIGTAIAIMFSAICIGYVYYRTKSLIPAIVAHALLNVPAKGRASVLVLVAMVAVVVLFRKQIAATARELGRQLTQIPSKLITGAGTAYFTFLAFCLSLFEVVLIVLAVVTPPLALILEHREKAQLRKQEVNTTGVMV